MSQHPEGPDDPRDPGWALVPLAALGRGRHGGGASELQLLRLVLTAFVSALLLLGVVVLVLAGGGDVPSDGAPAPVVAAVVVASGTAGRFAVRLLERPLDCSSAAALVAGYRSRFFLRCAFAEASALVGFAGFLLSGAAWLYPLGGLFTAVGFVRLAPSRRNLEDEQQVLDLRGCGRSLVGSLVSARPG